MSKTPFQASCYLDLNSLPKEPFNSGEIPEAGKTYSVMEYTPYSPTSKMGSLKRINEVGKLIVTSVTNELIITKRVSNGRIESFKKNDFVAGLLCAEEV